MAHMRYPAGPVQGAARAARRYHVTDPDAFYGGGDYWRVPEDPTTSAPRTSRRTTSRSRCPTRQTPAFSLTTTFIPTGRPAARSCAGSWPSTPTPGRRPGSDGGLRRSCGCCELPRDTSVDGPGQVQNQIEISTARSQSPASAQPVAVHHPEPSVGQAADVRQPAHPAGRRRAALRPADLRPGVQGGRLVPAEQGDRRGVRQRPSAGARPSTRRSTGCSGATPGPAATATPAPRAAARRRRPRPAAGDGQPAAGGGDRPSRQAYDDGQAALKAGDFAAYGEAQKRLQAAITAAAAARSHGHADDDAHGDAAPARATSTPTGDRPSGGRGPAGSTPGRGRAPTPIWSYAAVLP